MSNNGFTERQVQSVIATAKVVAVYNVVVSRVAVYVNKVQVASNNSLSHFSVHANVLVKLRSVEYANVRQTSISFAIQNRTAVRAQSSRLLGTKVEVACCAGQVNNF